MTSMFEAQKTPAPPHTPHERAAASIMTYVITGDPVGIVGSFLRILHQALVYLTNWPESVEDLCVDSKWRHAASFWTRHLREIVANQMRIDVTQLVTALYQLGYTGTLTAENYDLIVSSLPDRLATFLMGQSVRCSTCGRINVPSACNVYPDTIVQELCREGRACTLCGGLLEVTRPLIQSLFLPEDGNISLPPKTKSSDGVNQRCLLAVLTNAGEPAVDVLCIFVCVRASATRKVDERYALYAHEGSKLRKTSRAAEVTYLKGVRVARYLFGTEKKDRKVVGTPRIALYVDLARANEVLINAFTDATALPIPTPLEVKPIASYPTAHRFQNEQSGLSPTPALPESSPLAAVVTVEPNRVHMPCACIACRRSCTDHALLYGLLILLAVLIAILWTFVAFYYQSLKTFVIDDLIVTNTLYVGTSPPYNPPAYAYSGAPNMSLITPTFWFSKSFFERNYLSSIDVLGPNTALSVTNANIRLIEFASTKSSSSFQQLGFIQLSAFDSDATTVENFKFANLSIGELLLRSPSIPNIKVNNTASVLSSNTLSTKILDTPVLNANTLNLKSLNATKITVTNQLAVTTPTSTTANLQFLGAGTINPNNNGITRFNLVNTPGSLTVANISLDTLSTKTILINSHHQDTFLLRSGATIGPFLFTCNSNGAFLTSQTTGTSINCTLSGGSITSSGVNVTNSSCTSFQTPDLQCGRSPPSTRKARQ
ncbi:hypothetical protein GMRT_13203 [Giardia muris]|uniref:Uncharacterized protein n=1 Tax=Giardia muris TaxID=5742 RepID=A0A4Z1SS06_GIAMU|nr:hypothetical protein GMRT_13203 [Giardia muris]|eukprot:TNJ28676.1 hypothetical protein GMRT_13203 [Giardia muris]